MSDETAPRSLSCAEVLGRLYAYLDREESALSEAEIEHHLGHCRECFGRVEFEKRLRARVAEAGRTEVPEAVRARLNALIGKF